MSSTSIISITLVVILAAILVDVFCADVTNARSTRLRQNNQNSEQNSPDTLPDGKSTTPWPTLGSRGTESSNLNRNTPLPSRGLTPGPKKWIQQNNIWIRNEQGASGAGDSVAPLKVSSNRQGNKGIEQQSFIAGSANVGVNGQNLGPQSFGSSNQNNQVHQTNRQQALINGLGGRQQIFESQQNIGAFINNSSDNIQTSSKNKQQGPITGLGGNKQNSGRTNPSSLNQNANNKPLGPLSISGGNPNANIASATPPSKPLSYAGVVGQKIASPLSPTPKTTPVSPSLSPHFGGPKKDAIPSTGPTGNIENLDNDQSIGVVEGDTTDDELREFSEILLRKDSNNAMKYVTLNLQGMTSSRSSNDEAPQPLLKVDSEAYKIASIEKIVLLYNNYFLDAGQNEVYTGAERIEENDLLDTVLATPVMQYARSFLIQKGKIGKDPREFKDILRLIWFNMYSRGHGRIGSSGFEHIFLGEVKNNQVSGLHNWIYFNEEESQKRANYLGYLKKIDLGEKGAILKYHFTFHDIDKPVGSMFIGTSPELEMALYSTCFILRADKICPLKMNGNRFIIRTYTFRYRGKNMIGSAFPEI